MLSGPLSLCAVLVGVVALSEWLVRHTWLRHVGVALLVIVATALLANLKLIPTYGPDTALYAGVFRYVAPLGIFWLLLLVDLASVRRIGGPTLALFLVGALGTVAGVLAGHWVAGGADAFGAAHAAVAGMFAGTYIGGAVNFNAIALEYDVVTDGALYAGAAAVDNAMTALWMAACVALPRLLAGLWPAPAGAGPSDARAAAGDDDVETASVFELAAVGTLGVACVALSEGASAALEAATWLAVPATLILTSFALVLAQMPAIKRLRGARLLGLLAVYLFLAVIGTLCDLAAVARIGALAPALATLVAVIVCVHGALVFGAARLFKVDLATAAVASQANIGGGTSALALARGLGRADLELPAILVGSVGLVLGNYLGFAVVGVLA
ncbi:MAG: DUF819 family protein [Pseudomonadota bacterium]